MTDNEPHKDGQQEGLRSSPTNLRASDEIAAWIKRGIWILKILQRLCDGMNPGESWFWRSTFAYIGMLAPWMGYHIVLKTIDTPSLADLVQVSNLPLGTIIIVVIVLVLFPVSLAIALTHDDKMSYCVAILERGVKVGFLTCLLWVLLERTVLK